MWHIGGTETATKGQQILAHSSDDFAAKFLADSFHRSSRWFCYPCSIFFRFFRFIFMVAVLCSTRTCSIFFPSPFYHCGEPHLFYNMLSLLWKGVQLETSMSSVEFASLVATLLTMSQGITLFLAKSLLFFNYEQPYYSECAVGFSGVFFAIKVVLNSQFESYTNMFGAIVPSHYTVWAELILIKC